jgi:CheY-like chemotaxis protein
LLHSGDLCDFSMRGREKADIPCRGGVSSSGADLVQGLAGLSVFVVDDEGLVKMLIQDILEDMGCRVSATASTLAEALDKASNGVFDVAILDVNLGGQHTDSVAAILMARQIPFIFSTGYGTPPSEAFAHISVISKPFKAVDLERALLTLISGARK